MKSTLQLDRLRELEPLDEEAHLLRVFGSIAEHPIDWIEELRETSG